MNKLNEIIRRRNLCQVDLEQIQYQINKQKNIDVKDQRSINRSNRFQRDIAFLRGKIEGYNDAVTIFKEGDKDD